MPVAAPSGDAPRAPLKAYVHPCWAVADMLSLNNANERRSLDLLVRFRG